MFVCAEWDKSTMYFSISTAFILLLCISTITTFTRQWIFTDQFTNSTKLLNYLHYQSNDLKLDSHSETLMCFIELQKVEESICMSIKVSLVTKNKSIKGMREKRETKLFDFNNITLQTEVLGVRKSMEKIYTVASVLCYRIICLPFFFL